MWKPPIYRFGLPSLFDLVDFEASDPEVDPKKAYPPQDWYHPHIGDSSSRELKQNPKSLKSEQVPSYPGTIEAWIRLQASQQAQPAETQEKQQETTGETSGMADILNPVTNPEIKSEGVRSPIHFSRPPKNDDSDDDSSGYDSDKSSHYKGDKGQKAARDFLRGRKSQPPGSVKGDDELITALDEDKLKEFRLALPEAYDGNDKARAKRFIHRCKLHFIAQPKTYGNHVRKIAFVLSLLRGGPAERWGAQYTSRLQKIQEKGLSLDDPLVVNFWEFEEDFVKVFGEANPGESARFNLDKFEQGGMDTAMFITLFREYAADSGYDDVAVIQRLKMALKPAISAKITERYPQPKSLDEWYDLAIQYDHQTREAFAIRSRHDRSYGRSRTHGPTLSAKAAPVESNRKLTREERNELIVSGGCFYCRQPGHMMRDCPQRKKGGTAQARMGTVEEETTDQPSFQ